MKARKTAICTPGDTAVLAELFNQQRFAEAGMLARSLTDRCPTYSFGWKVLGAVLQNLGRGAEAVVALQQATGLSPNDAEAHYNLAVALQNQGRVEAAEETYRRTLALQPDLAVAHCNLGNILQQQGRYQEGEACYRRALKIQPEFVAAHYNLGNALLEQARYSEGEACYRRTLEIRPEFAEGHANLGIALEEQGRLAEAEASYGNALELQPGNALARYNLGNTFRKQGRLVAAEVCYRKTLEIAPGSMEAHSNLGDVLEQQGRVAEADVIFRQTLEMHPELAEGHNNVGNILKREGMLAEAEACYRKALEIKPEFSAALNNLAAVLIANGKPATALELIQKSLQVKETSEAKYLFVDCVRRLHLTNVSDDVRVAVICALTEPWSRPVSLARIGAGLVKLNQSVGDVVSRASQAWPRRLSAGELLESNGLVAAATDDLLIALLETAPICDIDLERFLTTVRSKLLSSVVDGVAPIAEGDALDGFFSSLSRQCFINEYVFDSTDEEIEQAKGLRDALVDALTTGAPIPAIWPIAVGAYFPLCSLPNSHRLFDREWPESVAAVLTQQVREPAEELANRATISNLTPVEDGVSLRVQQQYEESPYPRWIKPEPARAPLTIDGYLSRRFRSSAFQPMGKGNDIVILIAGCGTGQHPIQTAQRFQGARILAIDLSLASLGYAKRMTKAIGLDSIEYAQADILNLGTLDRRFDLIESSGVLHHLADPIAGWRVLLSLLRPGGVMQLGFYSDVARRSIVKARNLIAAESIGSDVEDIRRFRQRMMSMEERSRWASIFGAADFFSTSSCRDLLFHVEEHRMSLGEIDAFLHDNDLQFLGFEIDDRVLHTYRQRFPEDAAATNLQNWEAFEQENPDTFIDMYQFCVQKSTERATKE
ncbi:MAG: tetratricopeptide repeat protein [Sulfuritalea sp.]|nr:tetratricopeptide repeat protein [Sulfuritalea sp.]